MANLLAKETSPYLLSHKDNPVNWRTWGPEALAEAESTGKPIFLSIGYGACFWCKKMTTESFENTAIAEKLNASFICILVDREERPDIDTIHQASLQALNGTGGWPLNMFLTPKAEPFAGGSYFPPEPQPENNLLSFSQAIDAVLETFNNNKTNVENNITGLRQRLGAMWTENRRIDGQLSPIAIEQASRRTCQLLDIFSGGLAGPVKFPNVPIIEQMWRSYLRTSAPQYFNAVELQLRSLCLGGIYDHLGGGFSRYTADEIWLVPHFEKMLYDNALLIDVLATVWQDTRAPLYKARIEETVAWVQREMVTADGAFAAAVSAETNGAEGTFYLWTRLEIEALLTPDEAKLFTAVYDIRDEGPFQGRNVLHRLRPVQLDPMAEGRLNGIRQKLFEARSKRPRPAVDDKILADWNGLMIAALTHAADVLNRIEWQAVAVRAFWFVADKMSDGAKLAHSYRAGRKSETDFSEDYACMIMAALALNETTGDSRYLEKAQAWCGELDRRFWDAQVGGYFQAPQGADGLFVAPRYSADGATPSANGMMTRALAQLFFLTGEEHYRNRSNDILSTFSRDALANTPTHATMYNALDGIMRVLQIIIIGDRQSSDVAAFRDVLRRVSMPNKIVQIVSSASSLHAAHPAFGKPQIPGRVTVYLCNNVQCSAPFTDPNQFELALKTRAVSTPTIR